MIKGMFKLILLILLIGFISLSPRTRYMVGISLKQISSFLLWTVKNEGRENGSYINQVGYLANYLSHCINWRLI